MQKSAAQDAKDEFDCYRFANRFVFFPENEFYVIWCLFRMVFSIAESILYPYGSALGFPTSFDDPIFWILASSQTVFIVDMLIKLFVAFKKKGEEDKYVTELSLIAINYYQTDFAWDLIITLPLGYIMQQISLNFKILNLIKAVRIGDFIILLTPNYIRPVIRKHY